MKTNKLSGLVLSSMLLLCMASCKKEGNDQLAPDGQSNAERTETTAAAASKFKVVGYLPSWQGNVNDIQFTKLTHINYAFILPTTSGGFKTLENPGNKLQSLVTKAHANNVKVLVSVGGWGAANNTAFAAFSATAKGRTAFTNNVISLVNQYGLDGIDIDWEYPDGGSNPANYALLMQQLSTEMHNRGKLLSAAVISDGGASILNSVFGYVDFLNLMAYDGDGANHSSYDLAVKSLNYWINRGLPAAKANLGVPFYGRNSADTNGDGDEVPYNTILSQGGSPNSDTFNGIGYNGIPTMKKKTNLAFDRTAGGMMIWELSEDATGANSLLSAINSVVVSRGGTANAVSADQLAIAK